MSEYITSSYSKMGLSPVSPVAPRPILQPRQQVEPRQILQGGRRTAERRTAERRTSGRGTATRGTVDGGDGDVFSDVMDYQNPSQTGRSSQSGFSNTGGRIMGPKIDLNMDESDGGKSEYQRAMERLNEYRGKELNAQLDAMNAAWDKEASGVNAFLRQKGTFGQKAKWTPELRGEYNARQSKQLSEDAAREAQAFRNAGWKGF